jgi:hypothetical protein
MGKIVTNTSQILTVLILLKEEIFLKLDLSSQNAVFEEYIIDCNAQQGKASTF